MTPTRDQVVAKLAWLDKVQAMDRNRSTPTPEETTHTPRVPLGDGRYVSERTVYSEAYWARYKAWRDAYEALAQAEPIRDVAFGRDVCRDDLERKYKIGRYAT